MFQCESYKVNALLQRPRLLFFCTMSYPLALFMIMVGLVCPLTAQPSQFPAAFSEFVHSDGTVGASYIVLDQGRITSKGTWGMA